MRKLFCSHKWTEWELKAHLMGVYWERHCKKCGKVQVKGYSE